MRFYCEDYRTALGYESHLTQKLGGNSIQPKKIYAFSLVVACGKDIEEADYWPAKEI